MKFTSRIALYLATAIAFLLLCIVPAARAFADPSIPSGSIRIHYHRPDGVYSGWTVYAFDNITENTGSYGTGPVQVTGTDSYETAASKTAPAVPTPPANTR